MERSKNKILSLIILMLFPILIVTAQKKNQEYYQCAFFESYRFGSMASSFYAYNIAIEFYMAPFLDLKCLYLIGKSIELDPAELSGYIEKGNSLMFRTPIDDSDKNLAFILYLKALKLMETRDNYFRLKIKSNA